MKIFLIIVFVLIATGAGIQVYILIQERGKLNSEVGILKSRLEALVSENGFLKSDIEYYSNPLNLEKELRAKFNYKKAEEKMMIIAP